MTPQQIIVEFRRSQSVNWHKTDYTTWADSKVRVSPNAVGIIQTEALPLNEIIPKIACPTLLINGDTESGAILDKTTSESIRAINPKIQLCHIPSASHHIRRDKFDLYMQAVKDFLHEA